MTKTFIKFTSPTCLQCKQILPFWNELVEEMKDFKFEEIDITEINTAMREYEIRSLPTFIFIEDGKEIDRTTGYRPRETFRYFFMER